MERKRAAMAQLACDRDRTAVQFDQLPHARTDRAHEKLLHDELDRRAHPSQRYHRAAERAEDAAHEIAVQQRIASD
jgi:hypothetical protein